jgi:hypothetical protein
MQTVVYDNITLPRNFPITSSTSHNTNQNKTKQNTNNKTNPTLKLVTYNIRKVTSEQFIISRAVPQTAPAHFHLSGFFFSVFVSPSSAMSPFRKLLPNYCCEYVLMVGVNWWRREKVAMGGEASLWRIQLSREVG